MSDISTILERLCAPHGCERMTIQMDGDNFPLVTCSYRPQGSDGETLRNAAALEPFAEQFVMIPRDIYDRLPPQLQNIIDNRRKFGPAADRAFRLEFSIP